MSRVLVISLTDLGRDPRVDRQIAFLRREHDVVAAGLGQPRDPDVSYIDLRCSPRPRLAEAARQMRSLMALIVRRYQAVYWRHPQNRLAYKRLEGHCAEVVIANDLSALPLACRIAGSARVIFDAHELSTEEHADRRWWRMIMAPYANALLAAYLPRIDSMMTVAPGIAERYASMFGVQPAVVTNAPPVEELRPTNVGNPIRLIHHGVAEPQRQLELMIRAAGLLGSDFELSLMLVCRDRRYFARLKRLAAEHSNVRIIDPCPPNEIAKVCNDHDIGVYLLPPTNANLRYALPNKLFEFIQARLAIAIGPSPEMAQIVHEWGCGVVADGFTAEALVGALRGLTIEQLANFKKRSDAAARELNAEQNRELVLGLVRRAATA